MSQTNKTSLLFGSILAMTLILTACNSPSEQESLIGKWSKVTSGICDLSYPSEIEFFQNNTYLGALPNWRNGQYSVLEGNRIQLETTTGMGVYDFSVSGEELVFRNDSKCEFKYRRAKS